MNSAVLGTMRVRKGTETELVKKKVLQIYLVRYGVIFLYLTNIIRLN